MGLVHRPPRLPTGAQSRLLPTARIAQHLEYKHQCFISVLFIDLPEEPVSLSTYKGSPSSHFLRKSWSDTSRLHPDCQSITSSNPYFCTRYFELSDEGEIMRFRLCFLHFALHKRAVRLARFWIPGQEGATGCSVVVVFRSRHIRNRRSCFEVHYGQIERIRSRPPPGSMMFIPDHNCSAKHLGSLRPNARMKWPME